MINSTTQLEKINALIEQYIRMLGQARIALYIFPDLENYSEFFNFLSSFMSAIKRANCFPQYAWSHDSSRGVYNLLLIVNGYFRSDMRDVTDAAKRIWSLYSSFPIQLVAEMPICSSSIDEDKTNLSEIMNNMQFPSVTPQRLLPPHQRSFACSRLLQ